MGLWDDLAAEALAEVIMRWVDSSSSDVKYLKHLLADGNPFAPGSYYPQRIWQRLVKQTLEMAGEDPSLLIAVITSAREAASSINKYKKENQQ